MKSELIIDVQPGDVSIALLEDSRLVSLQKEQRNIAYAVGDIYLAKVKKLMPGLNASFVNVGYEKDAFLHYLDLGPHFSSYNDFVTNLFEDKKRLPALQKFKLLPDIEKDGAITEQVSQGKPLLVQIVKEPISSKGPRLTTEITFTGRYMVLIPFSDKISVSQKIKSTEEKLRLRQLVESIKPKNFGVIIRTSAEGKRVAELNNEMKTLVKCWEDTLAKAQKAEAPALIFEEESRIVGMLRDIFSPTFEAIYVNDKQTFEQIQKYVTLIAPDRKDIVKLYTKPEPIFDTFAVTRQIKSSFGKTVSFKSGAYIIIEHTEALHVIDVNSGNRTKATNDQETNALEVNLRAADEIARQLRLRDMGGIIVVDFIDMAKNEHRQELYEHMKEIMQNDRARHNILPLSKFGLMQITRQRVRPVLDITTTETCPSCHGKGVIQPSLLFTDTLFEKLDYVVSILKINEFTLYVHPYVEAYLKKGWLSSISRRWKRALSAKFKIIADQSLAYLQYRVITADGTELNLMQEKDTGSSQTSKTREKTLTRNNATIDIAADLEEAAAQAEEIAKERRANKKNKQTPVVTNKPVSEQASQQQQTMTADKAKPNETIVDDKQDAATNNNDSTQAEKPTRAPRRRSRQKSTRDTESGVQNTDETNNNDNSTINVPTPDTDSADDAPNEPAKPTKAKSRRARKPKAQSANNDNNESPIGESNEADTKAPTQKKRAPRRRSKTAKDKAVNNGTASSSTTTSTNADTLAKQQNKE